MSYGKIVQYTVASMYDGQHFGDLSMMGTLIKKKQQEEN